MHVAIVAVGKVKQRGMRSEIDEYLRRLRRYTSCEEVELRDAPAGELSARLDKAIAARAQVVALDQGGERWSSEQLAGFIRRCENGSVASLALIVGGADGLPAQTLAQADLRLSLSPMTLPHRLARLVLVEQLYRAYTINRNEPYAH